MIELLYNAVRAVGGEDINIIAYITDADGKDITSGCSLSFFDKNQQFLGEFRGRFTNDAWVFTIPADSTQGKLGRYWYRISYKGASLGFAAPIYIGR